MEVLRLNSLPVVATPLGFSARFLVDRKDAQVVNLVLQPGQIVPPHSTPVDVLFYVVSGSGVIEVGVDTAEVWAGDLIVSPANSPHGLTANAAEGLSVLIIKTPNPKHASQ